MRNNENSIRCYLNVYDICGGSLQQEYEKCSEWSHTVSALVKSNQGLQQACWGYYRLQSDGKNRRHVS